MSDVPKGTKCCERLPIPHSFMRTRQCKKNAIAIEDGKAYCRQHLPSVVAARREKSHQMWDEKFDAERKKHERQAACVTACEGIPDPAQFVSDAILCARYRMGLEDAAHVGLERDAGEAARRILRVVETNQPHCGNGGRQ